MSTDQGPPTRPQEPGHGCPSEVELSAFVDGMLAAGQHAAILAHVEACGRCTVVVGAVAKVGEEPVLAPLPSDLLLRAAARADRRGRTIRRVAVPLLAAAACLVLAALVWNPARRSSTTGAAPAAVVPAPAVAPDEARSPGDAAVPALLQPPPGQLRTQSVPFAWTRVPGAAFYEVRVTTTGGDTIWSSTTEATNITWDGRGRKPGARYFAWVSATMADGRRATSSIVGLQDGTEP